MLKIKDGVGIIYDLGSEQEVSAASIGLRFSGDHTTLALYATDSMHPAKPVKEPKKIAGTTTNDTTVNLSAEKPVKTRYVLLWITAMPKAPYDDFSSAGYKQGITDVKFKG